MPTTIGTYQCRTCDAEFEAKSDSYYTCPCGASEIKPEGMKYTFRNGNLVDTITKRTYYDPRELLTLSEKAAALYDEIKSIEENDRNIDCHTMDFHEYDSDKNPLLSTIYLTMSDFQSNGYLATNEIETRISLEVRGGIHADQNDRDKQMQSIEDRLTQFLGIMHKIKAGELRLGSVKQMQALDLEETAEQIKVYNHTFYI